MGFVDRNLMVGESVVWRGKEHWVSVFTPPILWFLAANLLWILGGSSGIGFVIGLAGTVSLVIAVLSLLRRLLLWMAQDFAVTDRRVLAKTGLIGRKVKELPLRQVESVLLDEGIVGRALGFASVIIVGTGGSRLVLPGISSPMRLRADVQERVAALRGEAV